MSTYSEEQIRGRILSPLIIFLPLEALWRFIYISMTSAHPGRATSIVGHRKMCSNEEILSLSLRSLGHKSLVN